MPGTNKDCATIELSKLQLFLAFLAIVVTIALAVFASNAVAQTKLNERCDMLQMTKADKARVDAEIVRIDKRFDDTLKTMRREVSLTYQILKSSFPHVVPDLPEQP